jgi:hypothetical protein
MLDHLSYSSVSSYLLCAKAWRYHYIDKVPSAPSPALVFGSAVHNAVEEYICAGDPLTAVPWDKYWDQVLEGEPVCWNTEEPDEYYTMGYTMLTDPKIKAELDKIVPQLKDGVPVVEKRITLQVPGVPIPIIGYIDVITADGVPCDFKTSSRAWSQSKAEEETQSLFYLAALSQAGVRLPDWTFRHYIFVKTKTPKFQMFEHRHNPGQIMWLYGMIRSVYDGIEAEIFPENPTGWKCSSKWCDHWSSCRGRYG